MTIDANIVIAYLGGDAAVIKTLSHWKEAGMPLFLSSVAEAEVLSFSQWTSTERLTTERFLERNFTTVPLDRELARIAAGIRRSGKVKFPDAAIAAAALFTRTPLVTRNQRDFKSISGLRIVTI